MNYTEIDIVFENAAQEENSEILMALLSEYPFESFEETPGGIRGFIPEHLYDPEEIAKVLDNLGAEMGFKYKVTNIPDQNWNETWESNYQPVFIDDRCYIRAPFHEPENRAEFDIVIMPKMSFGTAHHETTSMMISFILENDWKDLNVVDMGCGTGVLAVLAAMMGANSLVAIDNDEWAYNNAVENFERNGVKNVSVFQGGKELLEGRLFDVILANINRNILLDQMESYSNALGSGGKLFMSGFYADDVDIITEKAKGFGIVLKAKKSRNNWMALQMEKG